MFYKWQLVLFKSSLSLLIFCRVLLLITNYRYLQASLVPQMVRNLPAVQKTWIRPLGREDPLEESMATHSRTLAWRIPWTEESGWLRSKTLQRVRQNWATNIHVCMHRYIQLYLLICLFLYSVLALYSLRSVVRSTHI